MPSHLPHEVLIFRPLLIFLFHPVYCFLLKNTTFLVLAFLSVFRYTLSNGDIAQLGERLLDV